MSFILSWSGYFSRKGWDPKAWADANSIESYEQCVKRISKMCVKPPTEDQYRTLFIDKPVYSDVEERQAQEVRSHALHKQSLGLLQLQFEVRLVLCQAQTSVQQGLLLPARIARIKEKEGRER